MVISDVEHLVICHRPAACSLWRRVYSGPLPIFKLDCLLCWCWVVWALSRFWIPTPCQMYRWWICSPIQGDVPSFCWWFPLLCKTSLAWCRPTCFFFGYISPGKRNRGKTEQRGLHQRSYMWGCGKRFCPAHGRVCSSSWKWTPQPLSSLPIRPTRNVWVRHCLLFPGGNIHP